MTFKDMADHASQSFVAWLVGAAAAAVAGVALALVRKIFTNQATINANQMRNDRAIEILQQSMQNQAKSAQQAADAREVLRAHDRNHFVEKIDDLKSSIDEIKADTKTLFQKR